MKFGQTLVAIMFFVGSANAADWTNYSNARFGESIEIPPGFVNDVPEPENADGLTFHSADGKAALLVWGSNLLDEDFKSDAASRLQSEKDDGWEVSYQTQSGNEWSVYSGSKAERIMYQRAISSCKGSQALYFRIEYPKAQQPDYDPIVARLGKSLKAVSASDCP